MDRLKSNEFRGQLSGLFQPYDMIARVLAVGDFIDVGDECWRRNVFMVILRCW